MQVTTLFNPGSSIQALPSIYCPQRNSTPLQTDLQLGGMILFNSQLLDFIRSNHSF